MKQKRFLFNFMNLATALDHSQKLAIKSFEDDEFLLGFPTSLKDMTLKEFLNIEALTVRSVHPSVDGKALIIYLDEEL